jgi:hypothetical protein
VVIAGNALDLADAARVYLSTPGSAAWWEVTGWRQGITSDELILALPDVYAALAGSPLTATPPPGIYNLGVGNSGIINSNLITIAIAPRVDGVTNPPQLNAAEPSKVFTLHGAGFIPSTGVTLALGAAVLTRSGTANPGCFTVDPTTITFVAPTDLARGTYPLLLTVNGVAASIGWLAIVT